MKKVLVFIKNLQEFEDWARGYCSGSQNYTFNKNAGVLTDRINDIRYVRMFTGANSGLDHAPDCQWCTLNLDEKSISWLINHPYIGKRFKEHIVIPKHFSEFQPMSKQ